MGAHVRAGATLGELLRATFRLVASEWRRPLAIATLAALAATLAAVATATLLWGDDPGADGVVRLVGANLVGLAVAGAVLAAGFGLVVAAGLIASGQARAAPGGSDDLRWAFGAVVQSAFLLAVVAVPGLIVFSAAEVDTEDGAALLLLCCVLVASILAARLIAGVPAMIVEGLRPVDALRRSNELVRGRTLVVWLLLFVLGIGDRMLSNAIEAMTEQSSAVDPVTMLAWAYLSTCASTALLLPVYAAAAIVVYRDRVGVEPVPREPSVAAAGVPPVLVAPGGPSGARPAPWDQSPPLT